MCSNNNPVLSYYSNNTIPQQSSGWNVRVKNRVFPGHFMDQGSKHFITWGKHDKKEVFEKAMQFIKNECPGVEMVKGPWRDTWVAKSDLDAAMNRLKEFEGTQKNDR